MCVLIKIGQKYPYKEGVYRGVLFHTRSAELPTLEYLFIDAEMALREIWMEYNHKTNYYGIDPTLPSDCTIGALERGYVEKKYGALFADGYNDHLIDHGVHEIAVYRIFLKHQEWRNKSSALLLSPSGEGNKENDET
jgi:hypothetical protein